MAESSRWPEEDCVRGYEERFDLSREDAQNKDQLRLRMKGQPANPGLSVVKPVCVCVCVCVSQLLEECTEKLGLNKAARRLFLDSGREVLSEDDLERDVEVYVSTGEPFRNPIKDMLSMYS